MESESCSVMSDSLWPHGLYSPWNSPGQNTGVGSLFLFQGILPTQGSNPGLWHCRQILYQLSHKGSPRILEWVAYPFSRGSSQTRNRTRVSCITGGFFTNWTIREALGKWRNLSLLKPSSLVPPNKTPLLVPYFPNSHQNSRMSMWRGRLQVDTVQMPKICHVFCGILCGSALDAHEHCFSESVTCLGCKWKKTWQNPLREAGTMAHYLASLLWCMGLPQWHMGKNQPAVQETLEMQFRSLKRENDQQEEMATHSSTLVWKIPWTEEPGRLPSVGSLKSQTQLHAFWIPKVFTSVHPEATSSVSSVGHPSLFHQEAVIAAASSVFTPVHEERRGCQWCPAWEVVGVSWKDVLLRRPPLEVPILGWEKLSRIRGKEVLWPRW